MDNLEYAQRAVAAAKKAGADFAEASISEGRQIAVEVENGSIRSTEASRSDTLLVRAFARGGCGTVSVAGFKARGSTPEDIAREAAAMAKSADADPDFVTLPEFEEAEELEGLFDEALLDYPVSEAVEVVGGAVDRAREIASDAIVMTEISIAAGTAAIANSLGVAVERKRSSINHGAFVVIRRAGDVGAFYDFDAGNMLADVDLAPVGKSATEKALDFLGSRKVETRKMPVVLGPLASYSFLKTLASAANAESIQRKRSYLTGRMGDQLGSKAVTLVDNGLIPHGLSSGTHDGEGARRRPVTIFEEGRLAGMLHNSYTAGKAGEANTGHASRGGGISGTNVSIALGSRTAEEIVAEIKEGLYINMGGLMVHPSSGDISTSVDFGFKIEKGRLAYPVANAMVAGHIFEALEALDAVSSDYREEPGTIMPTIRIAAMDVSGG